MDWDLEISASHPVRTCVNLYQQILSSPKVLQRISFRVLFQDDSVKCCGYILTTLLARNNLLIGVEGCSPCVTCETPSILGISWLHQVQFTLLEGYALISKIATLFKFIVLFFFFSLRDVFYFCFYFSLPFKSIFWIEGWRGRETKYISGISIAMLMLIK